MKWRRSRHDGRHYWQDDLFDYAWISRWGIGWIVNANGHDTPGPFLKLGEAKAWVEKHVKPRRRASRKESEER